MERAAYIVIGGLFAVALIGALALIFSRGAR